MSLLSEFLSYICGVIVGVVVFLFVIVLPLAILWGKTVDYLDAKGWI